MQSFYNDPANANVIAMHDFARQVSALGSMNANARGYMNALNVEALSATPVQKMILFNADGSAIREFYFDSIRETALDLPNLPNGIYLFSVVGIDGGTTTNKLILLR